MATTEEYAQWIVNNADKKGTGQFNIVSQAYQESKSIPTEDTRSLFEKSEEYVRPALEFGGALVGGAVGSATGPVGTAAGGALGYAGGKSAADILYDRETPETIPQAVTKAATDIGKGAKFEAMGQSIGKALPVVAKAAGRPVKAIMGRLSGAGTETTEQALKAGKKLKLNLIKSQSDFDKAMRGEISGEDIVNNAQTALQNIKTLRSDRYVKELEKIKIDPKNLAGVRSKVIKELEKVMSPDKFDIKTVVSPQGKLSFDMSKSTLVEGQPVIKKSLDDLAGWDDFTAKGLDVMKKRMSSYVGQVKRGSPQEVFLSKIERGLASGLKREVPGYAKMTQEYSEATKLIKDIESGLMMRKQGMTGRIVADQTLRRLLSSMKDNFALRRDLVNVLSETGEDVGGQIAGYAMRSPVPLGLAGSGPSIIGGGVLSMMKPSFIPVVLASSPRVQGEFLRLFGKAIAESKGTSQALGKGAAYITKGEQ